MSQIGAKSSADGVTIARLRPRGELDESTAVQPVAVSSKCSAAYEPFVIPYLPGFAPIIVMGSLRSDLSICRR